MNRVRTPLLALPSILVVSVALSACGGSGKTHTTQTKPTPAGTTTSGNVATDATTSSTSATGDTGSGTTAAGSTGSGSLGSTTGTGRHASQYSAAFVAEFVKGCDTNGGTQAYCKCVIAYIENKVPFDEVIDSQKQISAGTKPTWYTEAIKGCLSKMGSKA